MKKLWAILIGKIGSVEWEDLREKITGKKYSLTLHDHGMIWAKLTDGPCIILTRRRAHMSTYFVSIGHFLLTGRFGYWSHVCMSFKDNGKVKILESVGRGVIVSEFFDVFNCDSVCILKPRISDGFDWSAAVEEGLSNVGKSYDNVFRIDDESEMSCVEVIFDALKRDPDYRSRFHGLDAMIKNEHNLTPQMFLESGSFDVVLEVRR